LVRLGDNTEEMSQGRGEHVKRYVEKVTTRAYTVPTDAAEGDGTAAWSDTTLILVQVHCGGTVGTGWTYGPPACAALTDGLLTPVVVGSDAMSVTGPWMAMRRAARNATTAGAANYAISAVDVALWDLKARLLGLPLLDLMGPARNRVPVYGSGGFTTYDDQQMIEQLGMWAHEQHIPRVKIKIGESGGNCEDRDIHRMEIARRTIGPRAELYVDANGAYTAKQAVRIIRATAALNVRWLEEPVSSDDLAGLHEVRSLVDADVAAGEYGNDVTYFGRMCAAGAVDCLQVDATRAGGYTGWLRASAVAAQHGLQVSGHCAPNLHAPVAAATPNLRHLEWFHDHVRIESMLFHGALDPGGGTVRPDRGLPGHGMEFDVETARTYLR
jgi:L-alanine-DL-glutamate epimerase-like enolase superfamily enzyme